MSDSRPIYVVRRVTCSSSPSCTQPGPRPRPSAIRCPAWAGLERPRRLRPAGRQPGALRSLVDERYRLRPSDPPGAARPRRCRRSCVGIDHGTGRATCTRPRTCGRFEDARGIPAKLVVAGMTSDGAPHRGSGRRRTQRDVVGLDPSTPPVMADFARAGSCAPRCCSEGAAPATATGVATHRYLGPKLRWSSGRLLNGWALVRIQPVPRCNPAQPVQATGCDHPRRAAACGHPSGHLPPFHGWDTILRRSLAEVRVLPVAPSILWAQFSSRTRGSGGRQCQLGVAQQESTCLGSKGPVVRFHSPRP